MRKRTLAVPRFVALVAALAPPALWAQVKAGPEFRVNTSTLYNERISSIAVEPDGDFVVAWNALDGSAYGVFAQRYDAAGVPRGGPLAVNTYTTGTQNGVSVAVSPKGDFVVAWNDYGLDGNGIGIFARRFDAGGAPVGSAFQVNTYTTGNQQGPSLAMAPSGAFVVVWHSGPSQDGSSYGVFGQRYDGAGAALGGEFRINAATPGDQSTPAAAYDGAANLIVAWSDNALIMGRRYDPSGAPLGAQFQVSTFTGSHRIPSVAATPDGRFLVAWKSLFGDVSGSSVRARRFDAAANPQGADFQVNTYGPGEQYAPLPAFAAADAFGDFVVAWQSDAQDGGGAGVFAQRVGPAGLRGAEFRVNTYTPANQWFPAVGSDAAGNFVATWTDASGQDGGGAGIYAQRFGGLFPSAMAVNTSGNGVLEPGETVDLQPSWRNRNGAAQAFGGVLGQFTGPAGAVYTLDDSGADYGVAADGGSQACMDCYTGTVSDPGTRPAAHWDASAVETITPDVQGQKKKWLFHVGRSFADVAPGSTFYRFVETLLHHGVTGGCAAGLFCPASSATREQMAVFVLVSKEGALYAPPACGTPLFADVPASSPFCRWIEELVRRGVAGGCGGGNYCPGAAVTREQMAVFVLRALDPALDPPSCTTPLFADVPASSPFCRWIEELARRGVVSGCGGGSYCPAQAVTREQMGVFLGVTFGLTLYGP